MSDDILQGQVWVSPDCAGIPPLLCVVCKLDTLDLPEGGGPAIDVVSVTMASHPDADRRMWPVVWHMPLLRKAFVESEFHLTRHRTLPTGAFVEGYRTWRRRFEEGRAGVFDRPIVDAYLSVVRDPVAT